MSESEYRKKRVELEEQKVKHLEKLATSVDILTLCSLRPFKTAHIGISLDIANQTNESIENWTLKDSTICQLYAINIIYKGLLCGSGGTGSHEGERHAERDSPKTAYPYGR